MKNPNFPAIIFLLLAWALIAILTATIITGVKLVVKLWAYLNPPKLVPSAAAVYAPIFEPMPSIDTVTNVTASPAEVVDVPISNRRCQNLSHKCNSVGKKPKASISALIREEFGAASCEPR
jgi:hypothetical protein